MDLNKALIEKAWKFRRTSSLTRAEKDALDAAIHKYETAVDCSKGNSHRKPIWESRSRIAEYELRLAIGDAQPMPDRKLPA